jgi:hypothetical protein
MLRQEKHAKHLQRVEMDLYKGYNPQRRLVFVALACLRRASFLVIFVRMRYEEVFYT